MDPRPSNTTRKTLPDLSFPPRYTLSQEPQQLSHEPQQSHLSTQKQPPAFAFPHYPVQSPAQKIPETNPPPPLVSSPSLSPSPLLSLPLEIRLQIYHYVLLFHPIHHPHLAPLTAHEKSFNTTLLLQPTGISFPSPNSYPAKSQLQESESNTVPPAKIPTGLLAANRQIYAETRLLPFQMSRFRFVNWFWSGVYAARQFSRALRPWQGDAVRWVGVEVLGRDLWVGGMERIGGGIGVVMTEKGSGTGEWGDLCKLWKGVRGLRLGIKGSVFRKEGGGECLLDVKREWIIDGLLEMKSLRWVVVEVEDESVKWERKVEFCRELERMFRERGKQRDDEWEGETRVLLAERKGVINEKQEEKKNLAWDGEGRGEGVWGLDI